MREALLSYYERELIYLRQMGVEFAEAYPRVAGKLGLKPERCEDPHTERLLEAFALLAARIHLRLDDEFPEITTAMLDLVFPHYLRPIPSMTVVEFQTDPEQGKQSTRREISRGTPLYSTARVSETPGRDDGVNCKFQTCYDTTLWPINVEHAQWVRPDSLGLPSLPGDTVGAIKVQLRCFPDVKFAALDIRALRFYLNGVDELPYMLYELLFSKCSRVIVRRTGAEAPRPFFDRHADRLRPVGFEDNEYMLPYPSRSFEGYRLLQEYFSFPQKFLFFEVTGLRELSSAQFQDAVELIFLISRFERPEREKLLEQGISASTFRLSCTPVVNLFPQAADPILLDQTRYEYPVVPDVRRVLAHEVFSVDSVVRTDSRGGEPTEFAPFFSPHKGGRLEGDRMYWYASRRRPGFRSTGRTDLFLSLVDASGKPVSPESDTLTVHCTCTNSDLPVHLGITQDRVNFEVEGMASIRKVTALQDPTPTLRPGTGQRVLWDLVSNLSLNYLSLVEEGTESFQKLLRLYNFGDSGHGESHIRGINKLDSQRCVSRILSDGVLTTARGLEVQLEFDEEQFVGGGAYLFATVLERFLAMYVTLNSFTKLVARTNKRKEVLAAWPPRSGKSIIA